MDPIGLFITNAGLAAFTHAQLGGDIDLTIAQVGFTAANVTPAPTLTALPGEFKRLATVSGETTAIDTIHMVVRDADPVTYQVRGFALYLADGTLFAVYAQPDVMIEKASAAVALLAMDLRFPPQQVAAITFGDANFLNPLATETVPGVARLATQAKVDAGLDDAATVTPRKLRHLVPVGAIMMWFGAANAVPTGWALCNGQTVQRSDGTGQIALPDLTGRVPVGAGGARAVGDPFGATSKTVNTGDGGAHTPSGKMPAHTHDVSISGTTDSATTGASVAVTTGKADAGANATYVGTASLTDNGHSHTYKTTGTTATAGPTDLTMTAVPAHNHGVTVDVTQPSLALFFIMRV